MKKFIISIFTILSITSCVNTNIPVELTDNNTTIIRVKGEDNMYNTFKITKYKFEGHMYQYHYEPGSYNGHGTSLHDPNCPCFNQDK